MRNPPEAPQGLRHATFRRTAPLASWRLAWILITLFRADLAQGATGPARTCGPALDSSQNLWAAADLDGDQIVDMARVSVRPVGNRVFASEVDLFAFCQNSVAPIFRAFPLAGLVLRPKDVDADDDQDLVLREPFGGKALGVWLNNGEGGFSQTEPSRFPGAGDDPLSLERRASPFHQLAASSAPKTHASFAPGGYRYWLAPSSPRDAIENPTSVPSAWQDSRQSRAPPFSF